MALKLQPNPTFWHPVHITVPGAEKPALVDFEFVHMNKERLAEFVKGLAKGDEERPDDAVLADIIKNWKGVDTDYSPSALRDLLSNYPASGLEILRGYLSGLSEARKKN
jgi:hypothetical protein